MEAISQPDIDVDDHGPGPAGPQRRLADRNRMFAECPTEVLVEHYAVLPERGLVAGDVGHCNLGLHEAPSATDLGPGAVGIERKGAAGDPPGLFVHLLIGFSSY